jgi:hypothetical protein
LIETTKRHVKRLQTQISTTGDTLLNVNNTKKQMLLLMFIQIALPPNSGGLGNGNQIIQLKSLQDELTDLISEIVSDLEDYQQELFWEQILLQTYLRPK